MGTKKSKRFNKKEEDSIHSKTQESLAAAVVGGVGGGLLLSSRVMTGAATSSSIKPTTYAGIALLILGIIAGFLFVRAERKRLPRANKFSKKNKK